MYRRGDVFYAVCFDCDQQLWQAIFGWEGSRIKSSLMRLEKAAKLRRRLGLDADSAAHVSAGALHGGNVIDSHSGSDARVSDG